MTTAQAELKKELIFPQLSYQIIGAAFSVFNELGWGLPEKDYQRALERELGENRILYKREVYIPISYKGQRLSKYFADFVIEGGEGKILLELKVVSKLGYSHARQTLTYLKASGLRLGILIYFTEEGVKYRRVLNSTEPIRIIK